ncbi:MAG: 16S rRNA (guanine(966)-N(2))-methyltransferase RsmD [Nevskiales bacterium]
MAAPKAKKRARARGSFRIIGGQWRGRRLPFVDDGSVRPTSDRLRETLFNWLANDIHEARCLDLFAGSGALGIEALSRGAASVVFVDSQQAALRLIGENLQALQAEALRQQTDALHYLQNDSASYDIAFVDPPFGKGLTTAVLPLLAPRLSVCNRVYLECERGLLLELPAGWEILKAKNAGEVSYHLLTYQSH